MKHSRTIGVLALSLFASAPARAQQPSAGKLALEVQPRVTITVLVDNMAGGGPVLGEWGVSYYVDTGRNRVLFDAGAGHVLLGNARELEVDLARTDAIVLSHGHGDHTRGLAQALGATGAVDLYVHPTAFTPRYGRNGERADFLSMPLSREQLRGRVRNLVDTERPTRVAPGLMVTGQIPRITGYEDTGLSGFVFLDAERKTPDPILDDQALFFRVPEGIVVVLGCGHAGVINTLRYVTELLGEDSIYAVIGGTHLVSASPARMRETIAALRAFHVQKIMLAHCTGIDAYAQLATAFPAQTSWPAAGTRIELGSAATTASAGGGASRAQLTRE